MPKGKVLDPQVFDDIFFARVLPFGLHSGKAPTELDAEKTSLLRC